MLKVVVAAIVAALLTNPSLGFASTLTFGVTSQRTAWDAGETALTPANVGNVVNSWNSPAFAAAVVNGALRAAHVYGAPLEVDSVAVAVGPYAGKTLSLVLAATTNGDAYAVNAFAVAGVPAGAVVWHTYLGKAGQEVFDGGMPLGVESTGIVDPNQARWYVCDHITGVGWEAFALDLRTGLIAPGWPVLLSSNVTAFDTNANPGWGVGLKHSQRGALNLSLNGAMLYVPMGTFNDDTIGWLVGINTIQPSVVTSFSTSNASAIPGAGIWAAGGVSISLNGLLYATTGNAASSEVANAGVWGESFLSFAQNAALTLRQSYTPWNLVSLEAMDADIGGDSVMLPPDLSATGTTTPHLGVFGSKQGVVYLLDLDHVPGGSVMRQPAANAAQDGSLKPPNTNAPLAVFGPYCDGCSNNGDYAKMRSNPAFFSMAGQSYVYVTGTPKASVNSVTTTPPCLVRLKIVTGSGQPAFLALDAQNVLVPCLSPGSPIVVGQGSPVVWVLDANVSRYASLVVGPKPILRAFDGTTMAQLWTSGTTLDSGGKYTLPVVSHGTVFIATDRIQAFSLPGARSIGVRPRAAAR